MRTMIVSHFMYLRTDGYLAATRAKSRPRTQNGIEYHLLNNVV